MNSTKLLTLATWMVAVLLLNCRVAHAGFDFTIPNVTVAPGESGVLDVLVSSNGMDSFQYYSLDFIVSGTAKDADPINFVESGLSAPQLTATNPDYIFLDDSVESIDPLLEVDFVDNQDGLVGPNDFINVSDATFSESDRAISSADGDFLLARLNFVAPLSATPGNEYLVSLDFGEFLNADGVPQPFASNDGIITISTTAVPEPSTLSMLTVGSLAWWGRRRRRRRQVQVRDDCETLLT